MNNYRLNNSHFGTHKIISRLFGQNLDVLDVGCNEGYLKTLSPNNRYVGIDYSSTAVAKAKSKGYIQAVTVDLNDYRHLPLKGRFNVIVFADILEHLLFPSAVLSHFVNHYLKSDGKVVISLPNVANFTVRLPLLLGKFNYQDAGILDRTHLHLYTVTTATQLISSSGLKILSTSFSSNRFGPLISLFPFLGPLLGYNLIFLCQKS